MRDWGFIGPAARPKPNGWPAEWVASLRKLGFFRVSGISVRFGLMLLCLSMRDAGPCCGAGAQEVSNVTKWFFSVFFARFCVVLSMWDGDSIGPAVAPVPEG
jgi:hypothetical protein